MDSVLSYPRSSITMLVELGKLVGFRDIEMASFWGNLDTKRKRYDKKRKPSLSDISLIKKKMTETLTV